MTMTRGSRARNTALSSATPLLYSSTLLIIQSQLSPHKQLCSSIFLLQACKLHRNFVPPLRVTTTHTATSQQSLPRRRRHARAVTYDMKISGRHCTGVSQAVYNYDKASMLARSTTIMLSCKWEKTDGGTSTYNNKLYTWPGIFQKRNKAKKSMGVRTQTE